MATRGSHVLDILERVLFEEGFGHLARSDMTRVTWTSRRTLHELDQSKEKVMVRVLTTSQERVSNETRIRSRAARDLQEQVDAYSSASNDRHRRAAGGW